jgi:lipoate-protein ligase B
VEKKICQVDWLGTLPYQAAWQMQESIAREVARGDRPASLLLLEHPHTFTAGRSTKPGHLLWNESQLARNQVAYYEVDRGGDITYHGPGQLVGYPLFKLDSMQGGYEKPSGVDTVGYIRKIEQALILALAKFGIDGRQKAGFSGVWVEQEPEKHDLQSQQAKKIASIGVKVDVNLITRHGFALNVNPEMRYWSGIIACGLEGVAMTSMAELSPRAPLMAVVVEAVIASFKKVFGFEMISNHTH